MEDKSKLEMKINEIRNLLVFEDFVWDDLKDVILNVLIPKNDIIDTRQFETVDFQDATEIVEKCFSSLEFLLSNKIQINELEPNSSQMKSIYLIIILCGEHACKNVWTNEQCISLSKSIVEKILFILRCDNLSSFLTKLNRKKKPYGVYIFELLLPKLTKESWKYFPAAVACYSWLLQHIKIPDMSTYVSLVLPVSLSILTDYTVESKVLGLTCLRHILINISSAELHWHIQIEVLYKVLKPLFYYREADIIVPLVKCVIEVADKSQPFKNIEVDLKWSFFDDVLSIFLPLMEFESDMERRCAYIESLCLILEQSNFAIGRWTARLLRIVEDYLKTSITQVEACKALNLYIGICWPLVANHWRQINVIAGRVIYRSTDEDAIKQAEITFDLLKELLPDNTEFLDVEYIRGKREKKKI